MGASETAGTSVTRGRGRVPAQREYEELDVSKRWTILVNGTTLKLNAQEAVDISHLLMRPDAFALGEKLRDAAELIYRRDHQGGR
jgi:hypothetical protein